MNSPRKNHAHGLNLAVARALTEARKEAGLTNEALAAALDGISLTSIQRYLSGRGPIDVEVLSRLCEAIGVSEAEVIARAQELRDEELSEEAPTLRRVAKRSTEEAGASEFDQ